MRLLLDTHIWLWVAQEPWKIASEAAREITQAEAVFLSAVSIWELGLLVEKKRITLDRDFGEWCKQSIRDQALEEAPLSWDVAAELPFTRLPHRDPADRFLVATAKVYDLTLVTADERLTSLKDVKVLANR